MPLVYIVSAKEFQLELHIFKRDLLPSQRDEYDSTVSLYQKLDIFLFQGECHTVS
jgi:hypothetical protein